MHDQSGAPAVYFFGSMPRATSWHCQKSLMSIVFALAPLSL
jgi:hypothetical protein